MSWLTKPANPKWAALAVIIAFATVDLAARIQSGNFTIGQEDLVVYITLIFVALLIYIKFNYGLADMGDAQADRRLAPLWPAIVKILVGIYIGFTILHAIKLL